MACLEQDYPSPSGDQSRDNTSDEDTEDASEPEMVKMDSEDSTRNGCRSLEDKLSSLRSHLDQLRKGTDPDYLSAVRDLEAIRDNRLFVADVFYQYELAAVEQEFEREKAIAFQHLEAKQQDLRECILQDLQDKRKAYDSYRHGMEVSSMFDSFEPKTMVTRKLRRRPHDPLPAVEKRRKPTPLSSLVYILDEGEVDDDLKVIFKGKVQTSNKNPPPVPVATSGGGGMIYEAKIEDGKLFYENRWFHKGQHIFIESKEHGQESGVVTSISQSEIWVKRLPDNSKLRIYLTHLTRGKYVLKRRSA